MLEEYFMLPISSVVDMLDTTRKEYDAELTELKTLPSNAILTIKIDDTVTAEYKDERTGIFHLFHLTYDYSSQKKELSSIDVDFEISEGTEDEESKYRLVKYIFVWIIFTLLFGSVLSIVSNILFYNHAGGFNLWQ